MRTIAICFALAAVATTARPAAATPLDDLHRAATQYRAAAHGMFEQCGLHPEYGLSPRTYFAIGRLDQAAHRLQRLTCDLSDPYGLEGAYIEVVQQHREVLAAIGSPCPRRQPQLFRFARQLQLAHSRLTAAFDVWLHAPNCPLQSRHARRPASSIGPGAIGFPPGPPFAGPQVRHRGPDLGFDSRGRFNHPGDRRVRSFDRGLHQSPLPSAAAAITRLLRSF